MKLNLLDTGYVSNSAIGSQTRLSVSDIAGYDGSSNVNGFELNVGSVSRSRDTKTQNKAVIDTFDDSKTSIVSVTNQGYSINLIWKKDNNTSGYDVNKLYQFTRMESTRGLKLLYPSNTTDTKKGLVEILGAVNTNGNFASGNGSADLGTVSTTTPYLIGRVKNLSISDGSDSDQFKISFNFEISG